MLEKPKDHHNHKDRFQRTKRNVNVLILQMEVGTGICLIILFFFFLKYLLGDSEAWLVWRILVLGGKGWGVGCGPLEDSDLPYPPQSPSSVSVSPHTGLRLLCVSRSMGSPWAGQREWSQLQGILHCLLPTHPFLRSYNGASRRNTPPWVNPLTWGLLYSSTGSENFLVNLKLEDSL